MKGRNTWKDVPGALPVPARERRRAPPEAVALALAAIDHTVAKGWQGLREPDAPPAAARDRRERALEELFKEEGGK